MSGNELVKYGQPDRRKASDEKYCHACGHVINLHANICVACGAPQTAPDQVRQDIIAISNIDRPSVAHNQIYCHGCGGLMHISALNCPKCGASNSTNPKKGSKDRVTAGLFALLLGGIGAHHFYLGNIILGILYLLFFWTFIPMVVAFIEGIIYLTQSDETFARKHP